MIRKLSFFILAALLSPLLAFGQVNLDPTKTGITLPSSPVTSYTWAGKPSASAVAAGTRIRASDVGIAPGMLLVSDGTAWLPDGPQVLSRSSVAVSVPSTTATTTLVSVTVPAGLMGINGSLRITSQWTTNNNTNVKQGFVIFSGTGGTVYQSTNLASTTGITLQRDIVNVNSASSQKGIAPGIGGYYQVTTGTTPTTSAVNTAVDTTLVLSGQKAVAGDTLTLEWYRIELIP